MQAGELERLASEHPELSVVDQYPALLEELLLLRNPKYRFDKNYQDHLAQFTAQVERGNWFYYPWLNTLVHFLPEEMHLEVRTGRNRDLITMEEQNAFYNSTAAVLGMSVGSHAALTITMNGGSKNIKLADMDVISGPNLNRIRTGFQNVGLDKTIAVARQIMEMNPYSRVTLYDKGINDENLLECITDPRLDVLVEEMDQPYFKFKAREYLKEQKIPLVMAADNGDGIIAHVERYDTDPDLKYFNGIMGDLDAQKVKDLPPPQLIGVIARTVGAEKAVPRMQDSVLKVGKTLYSWPQLGTAATMCGVVLCYLARRVILKDPLITSGIREVNLDSMFESNYRDPDVAHRRQAQTDEFLKTIGIK